MIDGRTEPAFDGVAAAFAQNFEQRGEVGASFVVTVNGRTVVDLWGGLADQATRRPWTENTLCPIFSGTKGLVATCMLLLAERGQLDLDQRVAYYWPEFAAFGKGDVLVRHILSHTAGLPGLVDGPGLAEYADDRAMAQRVAAAQPFWKPGVELCYHAFTFGWICGELVRRVDGRSIGELFHDDVATPLELATWIGLPVELDDRVATLVATPAFIDPVNPPRDPHLAAVTLAPLVFGDGLRAVNSDLWRRPEIPGGNAISTARSMARLYTCLALGGSMNGIRLLDSATVAEGIKPTSDGYDALLGDPLTYAMGFALQNEAREFGPASSAFGHCGAGGSVHGAWPEHRVAFSYTMNRLGTDLERSGALLSAAYAALD